MKLFVLFALLVGVSAQASDLAGTYEGRGHYGTIVISKRGADYLLTTCKTFTKCYAASAVLVDQGDGRYASRLGSMQVAYAWDGRPNFTCEYNFRIEVTLDQSQIYLSDYGPGQVYDRWPRYACPPASAMQYGSYIEAVPYVRK